jgi:hypothetical protein
VIDEAEKSHRGRPTRAEASAQALAGIDVAETDPMAVLRQVAADPSAPAASRVAACKALLAEQQRREFAAYQDRFLGRRGRKDD